jgi:hypothetical protein
LQNKTDEKGVFFNTTMKGEKKMPNTEKVQIEEVQIAEGTILNLDLTRDGKIVFKIRGEDGKFKIISEDQLEASVVKPGAQIEGGYLFSQALAVEALKKNPIKVYLNTQYGKICLRIDEFTGIYLGPC